MKKIKYNIAIILLLPLMLLTNACVEEHYLRFDVSQTGIYFSRDTFNYSFGVTPIDVRTYTYKMPIRIMGTIADVDRPIAYEIMADTTSAKSGIHYDIVDAVVPAGKIDGYIAVKILRDSLGGSHIEGYTKYLLGVRIKGNDFFTPTLSEEDQCRVLSFDNAVEQPNWLTSSGKKVWDTGALGSWHPLKFIKLVEYFHQLEEILPDTYYSIVRDYGENLEHVPYGDFYLYRTVFNKYVFLPMYEYFNDPDNRESILTEYPDFPFDFPYPF